MTPHAALALDREVSQTLVSVVIPAYNAVPTIDRTLASVRAQSHSNLDIVVVDDASLDDTREAVLRHGAQDRRVRLVTSPQNAGVGAARNRGAEAARGDYLAFIDADDLMTGRSIEARLATLVASGAGLVYSWSAVIDEHERVINARPQKDFSGQVLDRLAANNFMGNGSCAIVTREAFERSGGYNEALYRADAQGCEDYHFYLAIARHFPIQCLPEIHIGYRETANNMSSNADRMLRSMELVQRELVRDHPEYADLAPQVRNDLRLHIAMKDLRAGRILAAAQMFRQIGTAFPERLVRFLQRRADRKRSAHILATGSLFPCASLQAGQPPQLPNSQV